MAENNTSGVVPPDPNKGKKDKIVEYLENGMWFKDACVLSGITEQTGHRWKREDVSFVSRVEAGILTYKEKLIKVVNIGSIKDARVAIEVLKTRWPDEWNAVKKVEIVDPQKELNRIRELIYGNEGNTESKPSDDSETSKLG